ncbi:MAG: M23 family metallopeptidase [Burkholderiales bacterium]|nr:M23 family metallopeptidase [Burkholderiales bacterium]
MQIMITHGGMSRTRVMHVSPAMATLSIATLVVAIVLLSGAIYHYFFLKAAREGWPVVSQLVKLVVHDESAQRDKIMRENLDVMAQKVGDMQARMIKIEAMGERVSGMAGLKPEDLSGVTRPKGGAGGPFVPMNNPGFNELNGALEALSEAAGEQSDVLTLTESRLLESRLKTLMIPSSRPIDVAVGSGFGFRADPFTGRGALHTGLDFPSPIGTAIHAAAGGVVRTAEMHPEYGMMLEIDHGNGLMTRYGHTSKILVKVGDLIKRGQVVADVGTTGRSTGPHLHFEVLVDGIPQDPQRFLAGANAKPTLQTAAAKAVPLGAEHR